MKRIISLILVLVMCASLFGTAAFADSERVLVPSDDWIIITIDAGHGGRAGGGSTINGVKYVETELVLKIAYYLKEELETYNHVRVNMTRTTNSTEEYKNINEVVDRVNIAEKNHSDLLISLHLNGSTKPNTASGACVLVPNGKYRPELAEKDYQLARLIMKNLNALGIGTYGKDGLLIRNSELTPPDRNPNGTIADYYGIVRGGLWRNFMAVLVEHCFMDSKKDAPNFLSSDEKLRQLALADAKAIAEFYGLEKRVSDTNEYCLIDYRDCWAHESIDLAVTQGWVKGFADDTFRPYDSVTRGQFVTFVGRMEGVDTSNYEGSVFPDVAENSYCAPYIQWAVENHIVDGFGDGSFRPNEKISREQIAKILTCVLAAKGFDVSGEYDIDSFDIADKDSIGSWAKGYVAFCYANGLLFGSNGNFVPKRSANRAETCVVLSRVLNYDGPRVPAEPVEPEEEAQVIQDDVIIPEEQIEIQEF